VHPLVHEQLEGGVGHREELTRVIECQLAAVILVRCSSVNSAVFPVFPPAPVSVGDAALLASSRLVADVSMLILL
jgi:hypothetical protein